MESDNFLYIYFLLIDYELPERHHPGFFYGFFGFFYGKDYISIIVKAIPGPSGHHLLELPAVIGLE